MLFQAPEHSYAITREIAQTARRRGFDGIIYPSFFSLARTGTIPFPTVLGLSIRKIRQYAEQIRYYTVANVAIFGRPISEEKVRVTCINRLTLGRVSYGIVLGPVGFKSI